VKPKAGLVDNIDSYKWSSYQEYISKTKIVNVDFVLALFDKEEDKAIEKFKRFNKESNYDQCLEVIEKRKTISDKKIRKLALQKYNIELASLQNALLETQIEVLKYLKELEGSSPEKSLKITTSHP